MRPHWDDQTALANPQADLAPTPPMGWNSFDSFGVYLHERAALANVEAMAEKLKPFGYEYFVIDNGWFGEYRLQPGTIFPAEKHAHDVNVNAYGYFIPSHVYFPNGLRPIADRCHALGLKFGVHLMRGIPRKAYELNLPIQGTACTARDVAITDPELNCRWCTYCYGVDMTHPGGQAWYDGLIQHIANMGVDFIKYDDIVPYPAEVEAVAKAIRKCDRPITLSLSPGGSVDPNAIDSFRMANMLRVTKDIWDEQKDIDTCFAAWRRWQGKQRPGFWIDMDMIPFGQLQLMSPRGDNQDPMSKGDIALAGKGVNRWCQLSDAQKRTFITLRAMAASPLMMGGDLPSLDAYSLALITNQNMLACNQNGVMGECLFEHDGLEVWRVLKKGRTDTGWVGVFNRTDQVQGLSVTPEVLGLDPGLTIQVQNVWNDRSFLLSHVQSHWHQIEAHDVLFLAFHPASTVSASLPKGLGISSWCGWRPGQVSRAECPEMRVVPLVLGWKTLEPQSGHYEFDRYVGDPLRAAAEDDLYVMLMIWVRPATPQWLFTDKGVPRVYTDRKVNPLGQIMSQENNLHPYYFHPAYKQCFFALIDSFGHYISGLPRELHERIVFVQSAEGSTGDGQPYKGDPLDSQYNISKADWNEFRRETWIRYQKAFPGLPVLVNSDANTEEETEWMFAHMDVIALKHGMFSHGYHVSDNVQRLQRFDVISQNAKTRGIPVLTRGEMDGEMFVYAWSTRNMAQAVYWSGLFATHCRLDVWNLPHRALRDQANFRAYSFFNRYAGLHDPATSRRAFCALRDGLNAADANRFPEARFGQLKKSNLQRYLNIAAGYAPHGARMEDPDKAMGGGMKNRKRMGYNDVGWNILPGNYCRFLTQVDPGSGDIGWWHVDVTRQNCNDAKASIYSRFARGFESTQGKNAMYFDLHDDLFRNSNLGAGITFTVIYLDEVRDSTWELQYDNGSRSMAAALAVTNTGSGTWKTLKATVTDAAFKNGGPKGADIALVNTDSLNDIFHLIEVELTD